MCPEYFERLFDNPVPAINRCGTPLSGTRSALSRGPRCGLSPHFLLQLFSAAHALFENGLDLWGYSDFLAKSGLIQRPALAPAERLSPQRAPRERFSETLAGFRMPAWLGPARARRLAQRKNGSFGVASHPCHNAKVGHRNPGDDGRPTNNI